LEYNFVNADLAKNSLIFRQHSKIIVDVENQSAKYFLLYKKYDLYEVYDKNPML